jgi:Nucleoside H+ symporter
MASDHPATAPRRMSGGVRFRLSVMMFLQFFIWGAWFELGFDYIPRLGFNADWQQPLVFGAFNVGALVALFFSTQFADRKFAAEKFLAFSHLVGGLAILGLYFLPGQVGTLPGQYVTVTVERPATDEPVGGDAGAKRGVGTLPDGTRVVVEGVDADWEKITAADEKAKPVVTARVTGPGLPGGVIPARKEPIAPFVPFLLLMLVHSLFYVPTISITNSIAFANLSDPSRQFGPVRVWGTIGWIAASWPFIFILVDWSRVPPIGAVGFTDWLGTALGTSLQGGPAMDLKRAIFLVAALASFALAGFSLLLPHTPPKPAATGADALAWLKAMRLLKNPFVLVLFLVTFIDAAVHGSFFFWTFTFLGPVKDGGVVDIPANWVGAVMKIGQVAEILTMLVLGYVLKNLGWRWTMVVGVLGHVARFVVFAYYPQREAAILINVVHGICYAFFFATVYIFVDEFFPKDVRSSAQGLFNVLILGLGPLAANFACPWLKARYEYTTDAGVKTVNYPAVFEYSIIAGLIGAFILAVFFNPGVSNRAPDFNQAEEDAPPAP